MITLIELFAGIGTQYQAFKNNYEVKCIGISEIDPRPLKAYKALFGEPNNFGDITKIKELPKSDVWTYSFPCTDLSIAGKQEGFEGKHSSLIYEVYRLLCVSPKPQVLIMENVANICNAKFMPQFQDWIDTLTELGYTSTWKKIKANIYGGATIRERVYMISILNDNIKYNFPPAIHQNKVLQDFLEPIKNEYYIDEYHGPAPNTIKNFSNSIKLCDYKNGGQGNRVYSPYGMGVTLTATGGGKAGSSGGLYYRENKIYKLSPIEMCKVMGWPKEQAQIICSVLTPREVGFCMGNAIDLTVLTKIVKGLKEQNIL